jgi:hypothetical protein
VCKRGWLKWAAAGGVADRVTLIGTLLSSPRWRVTGYPSQVVDSRASQKIIHIRALAPDPIHVGRNFPSHFCKWDGKGYSFPSHLSYSNHAFEFALAAVFYRQSRSSYLISMPLSVLFYTANMTTSVCRITIPLMLFGNYDAFFLSYVDYFLACSAVNNLQRVSSYTPSWTR